MAREFNVKTFFTNEKEDLVMFHKVSNAQSAEAVEYTDCISAEE